MSFLTANPKHIESCLDTTMETCGGTELSLPELSFSFSDVADASRKMLESFVAQIYRQIYGAEVSHFHEVLVGCKSGLDGELRAVLGLTPLGQKRAFLEQYLDLPVERLVCSYGQAQVRREQIVELGNLAASFPGASRCMIRYMTRYLHVRGYRHVVFTATQALANSFARLHYEPRVLAKADQSKLRESSSSWGSYYGSNPQVMVGDVRAAYAALF